MSRCSRRRIHWEQKKFVTSIRNKRNELRAIAIKTLRSLSSPPVCVSRYALALALALDACDSVTIGLSVILRILYPARHKIRNGAQGPCKALEVDRGDLGYLKDVREAILIQRSGWAEALKPALTTGLPTERNTGGGEMLVIARGMQIGGCTKAIRWWGETPRVRALERRGVEGARTVSGTSGTPPGPPRTHPPPIALCWRGPSTVSASIWQCVSDVAVRSI